MKLELVSFELATKLKEIGFHYMKSSCYGDNMCYQLPEGELVTALKGNVVAGYTLAPTLALAQKWFRDIHNINITTRGRREEGILTSYWSVVATKEIPKMFPTHEESSDNALLEAVDIVKLRQDEQTAN